MAKKAGSLWVEGTDLHFVDAAGNEYYYPGVSAGAAPAAAIKGSVWAETNGTFLASKLFWVDSSGNKRYYNSYVYAYIQSTAAIIGSMWVQTGPIPASTPVIRMMTSNAGSKYAIPLHLDVAYGNYTDYFADGHSDDPAHTNTGYSDDPGHTNNHGDHTDNTGAHSDDPPHANDHSDHTNYHDYTDAYMDNYGDHQDSGYSDDPPHTNIEGVYLDIGYSDDPAHTNTFVDSDPPHTNTFSDFADHANDAHQDEPIYVGP